MKTNTGKGDVRLFVFFFFFQAEDGIRDLIVTGVQTCALPISKALSSLRSAGALQNGPRSRRRSSKPNLKELGGKARGSTPPRASNINSLRSRDRKSVV